MNESKKSQQLMQEDLEVKRIVDQALYGNKKSYLMVVDIKTQLQEIYESYNNAKLDYDKFYFPKIKYNGFYYELSNLVISKTLTNTETFENELVSLRLFSEKGFNDNILNKLDKFEDFKVSLIKKVDEFQFEYDKLFKDLFEFVDYDILNINYKENLVNTIGTYNFNDYIVYKEVISENKQIIFDPQFNKINLTYIDKLNLKEKNQLVDTNISNISRYNFNTINENITIINRFGTLVTDISELNKKTLTKDMRFIICRK